MGRWGARSHNSANLLTLTWTETLRKDSGKTLSSEVVLSKSQTSWWISRSPLYTIRPNTVLNWTRYWWYIINGRRPKFWTLDFLLLQFHPLCCINGWYAGFQIHNPFSNSVSHTVIQGASNILTLMLIPESLTFSSHLQETHRFTGDSIVPWNNSKCLCVDGSRLIIFHH